MQTNSSHTTSSYPQLLKSSNLKNTTQRMHILEVIDTYGHITIDDIYLEVSKIHSSLSLATVYKNIILMTQNGILTEVPMIGEKSKYEVAKSDHMHLICTKCNEVTDRPFDEVALSRATRSANDCGFRLMYGRVNLYGLCQSCS